jgi:fatty-acyl-CoA synthase
MSQLSVSVGPTEPRLLELTIGQAVGEVARRHAARPALVVRHQGYRATYAELWAETTRAAKALLAEGMGRGDRVGIWAANRYEWVVIQLATARVGAILVNVNPAYRASELEYALRQSGVRLLFLSERFRAADFRKILAEVKGNLPGLGRAVCFDADWRSFLASGDAVSDEALAEREGELRPEDAINIQYTSGTTGFPKGATLSHRNILNNGWFVGERVGYTEKDKICLPVPFYHCFGMVLGNLAGLTHGSCLVVPGESFDAATTLEAVSEERCTSLYGVPTMFIAELEHPALALLDVSSLRTGIMAGAPCPREVMEQVRSRLHMKEVTIGYGMTETSPISTQTSRTDPPALQVSTVGTVHPHVEVKIICPDTGETLPLGQVGELCTRGYSVMKGYWNDPVATAKAIDEEGWMHSGDLASLDEAGFVRIEGRLKDMIIRGGENIYPREIEEFLHGHPSVAEAHVVGVPCARYGEQVMAWVKPRAPLSAETLAAYCQGKIATYKIPRYWQIVDSFPMTVTGKVQKFRLRELGLSVIASEAKQP